MLELISEIIKVLIKFLQISKSENLHYLSNGVFAIGSLGQQPFPVLCTLHDLQLHGYLSWLDANLN